MIKLGTLSKLLTEDYNNSSKCSNYSYICEAAVGKISQATVEGIESLLKSGKTDEALKLLKKIKLDKVSKLGKFWDFASSAVKKTWKLAKGTAKVAAGAAATALVGTSVYAGIKSNNNSKDNNQPYDKVISTEPVYVMSKRHGQVFDDDDVEIKTIEDQEKEQKEKEQGLAGKGPVITGKEQEVQNQGIKNQENQPINIDLNQVYDTNGNNVYQNNSGPNFSIGSFIDKADNAVYDTGHAVGHAIGGGINSIENDAKDVVDTLSDTFTSDSGEEEEK